MPGPVTDPTSSAALTPHAPWEPKPFPGVENQQQLRDAFRIVNAWAKELKEWQFRLAAMSAITQVTLNMDDDRMFDNVVTEMKGKHDVKKIKQLLAGRDTPVLGFPTDVLGHPPGPPFDDTL